jgi:hypothetical protein
MSDLVTQATAWLAATGAPNWIVIVALLTSPWTWADKIRKRVGPLLDSVLPGGE